MTDAQKNNTPEKLCPCGSGLAFAACCQPYLDGTRHAQEAEALVRSRFTAFATQNYAYIIETTHPDFRDEQLTIANMTSQMQDVEWQLLDIREKGQAAASEGDEVYPTVTFAALYTRQGAPYQLAETSYFKHEDDRLYYVEGMSHRPLGYKRPSPKVGRNDPCPCGSGKKYKKCCASAE